MFDRTAVAAFRDDITRELSGLIQIPSVQGDPAPEAPFGEDTAAALRYILDLGERLGFETKNLDGYAGHIQYGTKGPLYGVLTHLDVVPPGDGWVHEPFGGDIEDGFVYGRGAADNKGPAVASVYILKSFAEQVRSPNARIRLIFGTNEESGMGGVRHYFKHEPVPDFGFSPDSGYPLYNREMGIVNTWLEAPRSGNRLIKTAFGGEALNMVANEAHATVLPRWESKLTGLIGELADNGLVEQRLELQRESDAMSVVARGISAHGGRPANGVSAIAYMVNAVVELAREAGSDTATDSRTGTFEPEILGLARLVGFETRGDSLGVACRDTESGELSVNWGKIEVTEESVKTGLNIRYPVTADFSAISQALTQRASRYGFTTKFEHHLEPLFIPEDNRYIQTLLGAYEKVTGEKAAPLSMSGGTYARMLNNRGVAFGAGFPGDINNVHQPDERVSVDSLMRHAEISLQALYDLTIKSPI